MSDRVETFQVGETVRVEASTRSGDIQVVIGEPGSVRVEIDGGGAMNFDIAQIGDVISIESRRRGFLGTSADITLAVPTTASLELSCTSGDIDVRGEVEELLASVASGDVRATAVRSLCRVNSASGDISLNQVGDAEINTASGTVRLGKVGNSLRLNSASGDALIREIGESSRSKVASGTVRIDAFFGSEVRHKSMSGDLYLGVPPRRTVELDFSSLSGSLRNRLSKGDGSPSEKLLVISVNAVSGDLTLQAAK